MRVNAIAAVLAVNVAAAAGLAYLWSDADRSRWTEPTALPPALADAVTAPAPAPAEVTRYRETLERPLFAANRKRAPKADPAVEAQAAADALKDVRLLGLYGNGQAGGIVVLRDGKVQRVAIGGNLGGWTVAGGGQGRSAELVRPDGQRRELQLALNNSAPAPSASQAPVAGGAASPGASAADPASGGGRVLSPEVRQRRPDQINQRRAPRRQSSLQ